MPPPPRMIDIFLRYLKAEGARVVFGVPGGLLHPFFAAIEIDPDIDLVVAKHEEGAAFMADGYARAGRCLSVCAGTGGPGATNLLTGVAVAFSDGVPLLVVTGQAPSYSLGKGAAQETPPEDIDIVSMFRPVTKYSAMVPSPGRLGHHLRRALRLALTPPRGPVHLNVPVDFWEQAAEPEEGFFDPATYRPRVTSFDRALVQAASHQLVTAERPVILVGSGCASAGAEEQLIALAELVPARVCTTPRAKGVFPENHPLSLGVLGFAGHRTARDTVLGDQVDVLMTIGASLNETTTYNWHAGLRPSRSLIQIDVAVDRLGRNYPVDIPIVGDAQSVLIELIYHIHRLIRDGGATPASQWGGAATIDHSDTRYNEPALRRSDAVPVTPQRWRAELVEALPDNAIVFSDIGGHMLFNIHELTIRDGQRFILNLGFGSMGHGTAAPIGAALACPDRPVIAIVGDACFTMNGMELLTAVERDVPVLWIVENNQMHGITWHGSKLVGGTPMESVRLKKHVEVAAISRAMGLATWIVDRPGEMATVVREAFGRRVPSLIEVRVDGTISPPLGDRAKSIAGFRRS